MERIWIVVCTQVPLSRFAPNSQNTERRMAMTPPLVMRPESTALAGEGATGWASVSHICSGTRPAFAPKPNTVRKAAARMVFGLPTSFTPPGTNSSGLPAAASRKKPISASSAPKVE